MRKRLLAALLVWTLAGCQALSGATVTILNTGDIHETSRNLPRIAGYVKQLKAEDPNVLFLDAGDRFNKGDLELMVTRGEAIGRIMSACGYDAAVMGNHEASFGTERLSRLIDRLSFPVLGANITWPEGLRPRNFARYKVFKLRGVTVAVIGCASEDQNHRADTDLPPARIEESIRDMVPELRRRADIVVLLIHAGDARDLQVARAVPGIDVIISGHSHSAYETMHYDPESETVIHKAGAGGRYIGRVTLEWDGRAVTGRDAGLIKITPDMPEDLAAKAARDACFAEFAENDPAIVAPAEMQPPDLIDWLAGAAARRAGAEFVIVRPADFARSLPAGPVSVRALLSAVPRKGLVTFTAADAASANAVRAALAGPDLAVLSAPASERGPITFLDLRWQYDMPFNRRAAGLVEAPMAELRRDPDADLWTLALDAARVRRSAHVPQPTPASAAP